MEGSGPAQGVGALVWWGVARAELTSVGTGHVRQTQTGGQSTCY